MRAGAMLVLAAIAIPAAAQSVTRATWGAQDPAGMRRLPLHSGGRVQPVPGATGATDYLYRWPGVYFEAAFRGDAVMLRLDDPAIEYRLTVDRRAPIAILKPDKAEIRIGGLGAGPHRLRLEKVSEGGRAPGRFGGFFVARTATPLAIRPRARQIEFIGDSSMTGFGLRAPSPRCAPGEAQATTDTPAAYPALIAKAVDADYQINAISGRGLIRNYGGTLPERAMGHVYPYALRDAPPAYRDPRWRPQLYVLSLMADFVTPVAAGERWRTMEAVAADYVAAVGRLAVLLHRQAPDAALAMGWPDMTGIAGGDFYQGVAERALAAARAAGFRRVGTYLIDVRPLARTGCARHYNAADQRWLAGEISAQLTRQHLLPGR
jgi:hypothetical protein